MSASSLAACKFRRIVEAIHIPNPGFFSLLLYRRWKPLNPVNAFSQFHARLRTPRSAMGSSPFDALQGLNHGDPLPFQTFLSGVFARSLVNSSNLSGSFGGCLPRSACGVAIPSIVVEGELLSATMSLYAAVSGIRNDGTPYDFLSWAGEGL